MKLLVLFTLVLAVALGVTVTWAIRERIGRLRAEALEGERNRDLARLRERMGDIYSRDKVDAVIAAHKKEIDRVKKLLERRERVVLTRTYTMPPEDFVEGAVFNDIVEAMRQTPNNEVIFTLQRDREPSSHVLSGPPELVWHQIQNVVVDNFTGHEKKSTVLGRKDRGWNTYSSRVFFIEVVDKSERGSDREPVVIVEERMTLLPSVIRQLDAGGTRELPDDLEDRLRAIVETEVHAQIKGDRQFLASRHKSKTGTSA